MSEPVEPKIKSNSELLKEIWDAQGVLNKTVGIDTIEIGKNNVQIDLIIDFFDEAKNEIVECQNNFMHKWWVKEVKLDKNRRFEVLDIAKVKLELIDALHFLTSVAHLTKFHFYNFYEEFNNRTKNHVIENNRGIYHILNQIILKCLTKEIGAAFTFLVQAFKYFKMDVKEIHEIYFMKNKANLERQAAGYSQSGKTEEDNLLIEEKIENNDKRGKKSKKK